MNSIKKIVVIGPESTGKSTLCEQLAKEFDTLWVPEYAREYLLKNKLKYKYEDLRIIAEGQLKLEEEYEAQLKKKIADTNGKSSTSNILFIDTNMYVMKVWSEFVFGKCDQWILDKIVERQYDLYFLCNPDLPWVADELREYPDVESRIRLYHIYRELMINQSVLWHDIHGNYTQRFESAVEIIKKSV